MDDGGQWAWRAVMHDPLVPMLGAALVALLFAQSVLNKVRDPARFARALAAYRLLPPWLVPAGASLLMAAEGLVVALVLWPAGRAAGGALAATLLVVYAAAMGCALRAGRHELDCGCGGEPQTVNAGLVVRNLLLAGLASIASFTPRARPLDGVDLLIGAAAALGLWGLVHVGDELLRQRRRLAGLRAHDPH